MQAKQQKNRRSHPRLSAGLASKPKPDGLTNQPFHYATAGQPGDLVAADPSKSQSLLPGRTPPAGLSVSESLGSRHAATQSLPRAFRPFILPHDSKEESNLPNDAIDKLNRKEEIDEEHKEMVMLEFDE